MWARSFSAGRREAEDGDDCAGDACSGAPTLVGGILLLAVARSAHRVRATTAGADDDLSLLVIQCGANCRHSLSAQSMGGRE
ncbi:hypothetical protein KCP73_00070 [Salmonella enterica subsp. enterica]|nr:hypothetical protein KCP73_00070 [Salmonella enterica subsp. enterica]